VSPASGSDRNSSPAALCHIEPSLIGTLLQTSISNYPFASLVYLTRIRC